MKKIATILLLSAFCLKGYSIDSTQALDRLKQGNRLFVQQHPQEVFEKNTSSQSPFAVILSCADSRVPPEQIFNQGIGNLFVVRVAGNIAAPAITDSIVFAADALQSSLIVVLGHQNCGAVNAVLTQSQALSDLQNIVPYIETGVEMSSKWAGDALVNAIQGNVMEQVKSLKMHPILSRLIGTGKLAIIGAYYHLESGEVEFLAESTHQ